MPPAREVERTESDTPPCLIDFRRLTLRSATGTPQRGGPYRLKTIAEEIYPGVHSALLLMPAERGRGQRSAITQPRGANSYFGVRH